MRRRRRTARRAGGRRDPRRRRAAARARACGRSRGGRVAAVVGGEHEQVALGIEPLEPGRDRGVDRAQRAVEALDVLAVAVDLVGLDEVREDEAAVELVDQGRGRVDRLRVGGALVLVVDADAGEHLPDLADGVGRDAVGLQLLQVGAPGRRQREVLAALRALERPGLAPERARDHAADGVLALHDLARDGAGGVELGGRALVDVRGDLQHRVGGRVDDQVAGLQVLLAEVVDHRGAAVGLVAEHAAAGAVDQLLDDLLGEAVGIGAQGDRRDRPHQLPVAGDRVLARALRVQAAVDDGIGRGRDADERQRGAEPERAHHRQVEPAADLGDVPERVRPGVAVVGGVGQLARTAGVEHDHEGAPVHGRDSTCDVRPSRGPRVGVEVDVLQAVRREVGVELRGGDVGVAEHLLQAAQVAAAGEQVRRERVPERVRAHLRGQPRRARVALHDLVEALAGQPGPAVVEEQARLPAGRRRAWAGRAAR